MNPYFLKSDEYFMRLALAEAHKGLGRTSPNPAVGAIIVSNGEILSRGWHRRAGLPHAEIEAIRALPSPDLARGATIYVTLEPCSSHGRTPPCVAALITHGFRRVVVGATDPNPVHAGQGFALLRQVGIAVKSGVIAAECSLLNEAFNKWVITRQPFVIGKAAMSLDGCITRPPIEGQWLTSNASRAYVQRLRAQAGAIMVGAETVRQDNPRLTVRNSRGKPTVRQPWRVVITRSGNLPEKAHLFTDQWKDRTLVFSDLQMALMELGRREILSVLLEGGGQLLGSAFDQELVDRVELFYAPMVTAGHTSAVAGKGVKFGSSRILLRETNYRQIADDLHLSGLVGIRCEGSLVEREI